MNAEDALIPQSPRRWFDSRKLWGPFVIGVLPGGSALLRLVRRCTPYRLHRRVRRWHSFARARRQIPTILRSLQVNAGHEPTRGWTVHWAVWTGVATLDTKAPPIGTRVVAAVGPKDGVPILVLKLPTTRAEISGFRRQQDALLAIHAISGGGEFRSLLPRLVTEGNIARQVFYAEEARLGTSANDLFGVSPPVQLLTRAAQTIGELHRQTAAPVLTDRHALRRWVEEPLRTIARALNRARGSSRYTSTIESLETELEQAFAGRILSVGWVHGDYWLGNVLIRPETGEITGIIDWDRAAPGELPAHDVLHMLLVRRMFARPPSHQFFGEAVASFLSGAGWTMHERQVLAVADLPFGADDRAGQQLLVLLCWIRRVVVDLRSVDTPPSGSWIERNIEAVLALLELRTHRA
jgi:phosphotransferase family enzyme